jgi:hypothetical protein
MTLRSPAELQWRGALPSARPRLPPDTARRIDRLAKRAHRFHRYAHHPLCPAYACEIIAMGRMRVCRGCLFAVLGTLGGLCHGVLAPWRSSIVLGIMAVCFSLATGSVVRPRGKLVKRLVPAWGAALVVAACLRTSRGAPLLTVVTIVTLAAAGAATWLAYRRRGPNRDPCAKCPERTAGTRNDSRAVCSGLLPIVRRESAFQRLAGRMIDGSGPRPIGR